MDIENEQEIHRQVNDSEIIQRPLIIRETEQNATEGFLKASDNLNLEAPLTSRKPSPVKKRKSLAIGSPKGIVSVSVMKKQRLNVNDTSDALVKVLDPVACELTFAEDTVVRHLPKKEETPCQVDRSMQVSLASSDVESVIPGSPKGASLQVSLSSQPQTRHSQDSSVASSARVLEVKKERSASNLLNKDYAVTQKSMGRIYRMKTVAPCVSQKCVDTSSVCGNSIDVTQVKLISLHFQIIKLLKAD